MSLQSLTVMREFVQLMYDLWDSWLEPANTDTTNRILRRRDKREYMIRNAMNRVTRGFMRPPEVVFRAMKPDNFGYFSWPAWKLAINRRMTEDDGITYGDFIELCLTAYHETRHCEQFYRVAQGLAAGVLSFPDKTRSEIVDTIVKLSGGLSVREKVALYQGGPVVLRDYVIAKWLNIPIPTAAHAVSNKAGFAAFCNLDKPSWFRRRTTKLEVEEWMRECYKTTLGGLGNWAQHSEDKEINLPNGKRKVVSIYADQPTENDAFGIEDTVTDMLTRKIGKNYSANKNQRRTNTALFGAVSSEPPNLANTFFASL